MNWTAQSENIRISLQDIGAMLTAGFRIGDRWISPLFIPHWHHQEIEDSFLQHMKGDFFCVPFGQAGESQLSNPSPRISNPSPRKGSKEDTVLDSYSHGYSCNGRYTLLENNENMLRVRLEYPSSAVKYTEREILCRAEDVLITDRIAMVEDARLPVGIHPIFSLSAQPRQSILSPPECTQIESYPFPSEKTSRIVPGQRFVDLAQAPLLHDQMGDFQCLPTNEHSEELLLLTNVRDGIFSLERRDERYRVTLRWDREAYRHCMLWISNHGRETVPWDGQNCCLGIEPVTSCFDFGRSVSAGENPLHREGIDTALDLKAGQCYEWWHSISVDAL